MVRTHLLSLGFLTSMLWTVLLCQPSPTLVTWDSEAEPNIFSSWVVYMRHFFHGNEKSNNTKVFKFYSSVLMLMSLFSKSYICHAYMVQCHHLKSIRIPRENVHMTNIFLYLHKGNVFTRTEYTIWTEKQNVGTLKVFVVTCFS